MHKPKRLALLRKLPYLLLLLALLLPAPIAHADEGLATWYGEPFHGRVMYGGQVFDMYDPTTTAANIFPIGTWVKVTNPANGNEVVVQVRDRGGFKHALDLSFAAFQKLADPNKMLIPIRYEVVAGPDGAPLAQKTAAPPAPVPQPSKTEATAPAAKPAAGPPAASKPPATLPAPESYQVVKGDTLFAIAKRFGLSQATIAQWNDIKNPDLLKQGLVLSLKAPPEPTSRDGARLSAPVKASNYVVEDGDTLWHIAGRFGASSRELAKLNGVDEDAVLSIGQTLRLPAGASNAAPRTYVVEDGDTLIAVAAACGSTVDALAKSNNLGDANFIRTGQELTCS